MTNNQGFDLSGLEKFEEDSSPSGEAFDKSLDIIKESMKGVIQEILLTLPDGTAHMVYITGLKMSDTVKDEVEVSFNTPSTDRKAELYEHVENCVKIQLEQQFKEIKKKKFWF